MGQNLRPREVCWENVRQLSSNFRVSLFCILGSSSSTPAVVTGLSHVVRIALQILECLLEPQVIGKWNVDGQLLKGQKLGGMTNLKNQALKISKKMYNPIT